MLLNMAAQILVYINGQFIEGERAAISPLDLSVLRGFGVMDYVRTYGKKPFRLEDHLRRFFFSAEAIGLQVPKTLAQVEQIIHELIARVPFEEVSLKIVLTGGLSEDQLLPQGAPTFFAIAYPLASFPKECFERGITLPTACYRRPLPKAKTTQYLPAIVALQKAAQKGALDVLFCDETGTVLETATANFFALKGEKLITPRSGVLEGVTRAVVLELEEVEEREIHKSEISTFDGAFLASSNKEIMPVIQIDQTLMNKGVIPPKIREVMDRFAAYVHGAPVFS